MRAALRPPAWPTLRRGGRPQAEITVPVQVNGKVRARVTVPADIPDDELREAALADPQVVRHLEGKTVRKVVIAAGTARLVSVVAS